MLEKIRWRERDLNPQHRICITFEYHSGHLSFQAFVLFIYVEIFWLVQFYKRSSYFLGNHVEYLSADFNNYNPWLIGWDIPIIYGLWLSAKQECNISRSQCAWRSHSQNNNFFHVWIKLFLKEHLMVTINACNTISKSLYHFDIIIHGFIHLLQIHLNH